MSAWMRTLLLSAARNRRLNQFAKQYGLLFGASRFVAGERIEDAVSVVRTLSQSGLSVTLDHLGEFITNESDAMAATEGILNAIEVISGETADVTVSVKLTQLGLDVSRQLCLDNLERIVSAAYDAGRMVTIDMEDYGHYSATLDMYRKVRRDYPNVGIVIQAYLRRSLEDVATLATEGAYLRIVKGAYKESIDVAYADKSEVDANYLKLVEAQLLGRGFTAIATHDERIIRYVQSLIVRYQMDASHYEFQMLYGIRPSLAEKLVNDGYPVRIYVPYGTDWFGYFMRRLAERPENAMFVLRGALR